MNLLYVIAPRGGPEAYVKVLGAWLVKRGHRVTVLCISPSGRENPSFADGLRVLYSAPGTLHYYLGKLTGRLRNWPVRLRSMETEAAVLKAALELEKSEKIDLIEVTEGLPISRLKRRWPVLVRAHGSDWLFRQMCLDGDGHRDDLLIKDAARQFRQADVVSPISSDLADQLSLYCEIPREKFEPVPYPVDTRVFAPEGPEIEPTGHPLLMSIGRFEHRKGTDVLVRSMLKVWQEYPNARLLLLGSPAGFTTDYLLSLVPVEKQDCIIFPGFIEHSELPAYLRSVDLYIAPSQYETLGYTILEAMACGKAVISCPVGAVPELIIHGKNGWLVPFGTEEKLGEAIVRLLQDHALRKSLAAEARETAETYDTDKICPMLEELYLNSF